jgi:hypothetical protein
MISLCLFRIMREHFRFDITLHVSGLEKLLLHPQERHSQRHVELHAKGGRAENHPAHARSEVVDPGRDGDRANAMRQHDHILCGDAVFCRDMPHKRVHVFDHCHQIFGGSAFTG